MLQADSHAPDFSLPDSDMEMLKLSSIKGKNVVVYFYPKDDTPGCTLEAIEFSDMEDEFTHYNTVVLGTDPAKAVSDGKQSLKPEKFAEMVKQVGQIAQIMGRTLASVQGEYSPLKQGWA